MKKKIKTFVIDRDLSIREAKKYPISKDGSRISIKSGGKGNFNPLFDNDCILELPKRFGTEKVVFVKNRAKSCIKFRQIPNELLSNIKTFADLEELFKAAEEGNPEAQYQLQQVLSAIEDAGRADYIKPDPEIVEEMASNEIAKGLGSDPKPDVQWYTWVQLALIGFLVLLQLGVIG